MGTTDGCEMHKEAGVIESGRRYGDLPLPGGLGTLKCALMGTFGSGGGKLAEAVADHILDNRDGEPLATVMDLDSLADPVREDHTATGAAPDVGELG